MDRMKTFFLYFLGIVGFIFLSYILEDGLIENMYYKMTGDVTSSLGVVIDDVAGKATNMNGYMQFKLSNKSNSINSDYVKIELYSKQGLLGVTEYVKINDLEPGHSRIYNVKFNGSELRSYKISIVDEAPDKTNIINILGWEIDLTNVLGMDLSNIKIFGVRLADIFNWENIKTAGGNAWNWTINFMSNIPWWGYTIAWGIILWYMPKGFLFGIFPL